mgnify:CR=1 FL=1
MKQQGYMDYDTFQDELHVINTAESLLEAPSEVDFKSEYANLLQSYKDLTKISRRLIRMSDRSEEALREANSELRTARDIAEAAKAETREFIAMTSHELRTPLAVLKSEIELLSEGIRQPNKKNLHSLSDEVDHFSGLINDMFELSLTDINALSFKDHEIDIADLLEKSVAHFQPLFKEKAIEIQFEKTKHPITLNIDGQRVKQVFGNILKNSYHYTDTGGKLLVRILQLDNAVQLDFSDSAPGLNDEGLNKIFNRFFRAEGSRNRSTGGAGLGMAICKSIMENYNGSISAQHALQGGVSIQLQFPLNLTHQQ